MTGSLTVAWICINEVATESRHGELVASYSYPTPAVWLARLFFIRFRRGRWLAATAGTIS